MKDTKEFFHEAMINNLDNGEIDIVFSLPAIVNDEENIDNQPCNQVIKNNKEELIKLEKFDFENDLRELLKKLNLQMKGLLQFYEPSYKGGKETNKDLLSYKFHNFKNPQYGTLTYSSRLYLGEEYTTDSKVEDSVAIEVLRFFKLFEQRPFAIWFVSIGISKISLDFMITNYLANNYSSLTELTILHTKINNTGFINLFNILSNNKTLTKLTIDERATMNVGINKALLKCLCLNNNLKEIQRISIYEEFEDIYDAIMYGKEIQIYLAPSFSVKKGYYDNTDYDDDWEKKREEVFMEATQNAQSNPCYDHSKCFMSIKELLSFEDLGLIKDILGIHIIDFIRIKYGKLINESVPKDQQNDLLSYFDKLFSIKTYGELQIKVTNGEFIYPKQPLDFIKFGFNLAEINFPVLLKYANLTSIYEIILLNNYVNRGKSDEQGNKITNEASTYRIYSLVTNMKYTKIIPDTIAELVFFTNPQNLEQPQLDDISRFMLLLYKRLPMSDDQKQITAAKSIEAHKKAVRELTKCTLTEKVFFKEIVNKLPEYQPKNDLMNGFHGNIKELASDLLVEIFKEGFYDIVGKLAYDL